MGRLWQDLGQTAELAAVFRESRVQCAADGHAGGAAGRLGGAVDAAGRQKQGKTQNDAHPYPPIERLALPELPEKLGVI